MAKGNALAGETPLRVNEPETAQEKDCYCVSIRPPQGGCFYIPPTLLFGHHYIAAIGHHVGFSQ